MTDLLHLQTSDVSVVIDARSSPDTPSYPSVIYWGAPLGPICGTDLENCAAALAPSRQHPNTLTVPIAILPQASTGYAGTPGLEGHRSGRDWTTMFSGATVTQTGENTVSFSSTDPLSRLTVTTDVELTATSMLRIRHRVRNDGNDPYTVDGLNVALPVPGQARELLDFTGHHLRERHPQRHDFPLGKWVRESRRGRPGHDATIGLLAGTPGFTFQKGEVWAIHVAWSGNHQLYAERLPRFPGVLGGGELLFAGEIVLASGDTYETPWVFAAYSDQGIDGLSAVFHRWFRARPQHPGTDRPRPVTLNTWEAVYFDHDLGKLTKLADAAAEVGVERFVLDDGWFRHRRDDTAGLGDWFVDETVWPEGLSPIIDHVRGHGMQFGLWVEPEMINPDSDLCRAHPDWVLAPAGRTPPTERDQQVLNIAHPGAFEYILERLDSLLTEYDIAYLKWDHNRDLVDPGADGKAGVHAQTAALYRLLDELQVRHPSVEIESCAGGGGRVDFGILQRAVRIWASDCNDALERQTIQRYTSVFVPPELIGAHIGPPRAHTTARTHDLSFRAVTALFGHLGIEWDITAASTEDRIALGAIIDFYKSARGVLHTGDVVRIDSTDPACIAHGVTSPDRTRGIYSYVKVATSALEIPDSVRLPGLDPDTRYHIRLVAPAGQAWTSWHPSEWASTGEIILPGRVLATAGIRPPVLGPEQALLITAAAVTKE